PRRLERRRGRHRRRPLASGPLPRVRLALLRRDEEPQPSLVRHGGLRQPRQGAPVLLPRQGSLTIPRYPVEIPSLAAAARAVARRASPISRAAARNASTISFGEDSGVPPATGGSGAYSM